MARLLALLYPFNLAVVSAHEAERTVDEPDQDAVHTLAGLLDQLGIKGEVCFSVPDVLDMMASSRYSAILLILKFRRRANRAEDQDRPAGTRPVVFALIGALNQIAGAFASGPISSLYKPLARDQVLRSLRAGQAFMLPDRRRSQRHSLETLAYLQFGIAAMPALVLDVNDHGISIQSPEPLPGVREVRLRFVLPGTTEIVEATGDLLWADREGRAGMLFADMLPLPQEPAAVAAETFGPETCERCTYAYRIALAPPPPLTNLVNIARARLVLLLRARECLNSTTFLPLPSPISSVEKGFPRSKSFNTISNEFVGSIPSSTPSWNLTQLAHYSKLAKPRPL